MACESLGLRRSSRVRERFRSFPMSRTDDRAAFAEKVRAQTQALGKDPQVFEGRSRSAARRPSMIISIFGAGWASPSFNCRPTSWRPRRSSGRPSRTFIIETGVAAGRLGAVHGVAAGDDRQRQGHRRRHRYPCAQPRLIERHPMAKRVVLVEGASTAADIVAKAQIPRGASVMVVLESITPPVLAELRCYGPLVTQGCYLVVADTLLGKLKPEQPPRNRSKVWLKGNEPRRRGVS